MIMRSPRLNAIRVFDAAARHLNFRLAAEELNVTQGAIAQSIRGLEKDLGIKLFKRLARGLALTAPARAYHSEIARGLTIIDQATRALLPNASMVTISVPPSFASKWLVPRLARCAEAHPAIEVRLIASETVTDFSIHEVDVAVRQGPRPSDPGLTVHHLGSVKLCALASPQASFSTRQVDSLIEIADYPLIQDSHFHWQRFLTEIGATIPGQFLQFNQTALALDAAANGQGIAIAPDIIARNDLALGRLVKIWQDPRLSDVSFWLVHPKAEAANEAARANLVEWLIDETRQ